MKKTVPHLYSVLYLLFAACLLFLAVYCLVIDANAVGVVIFCGIALALILFCLLVSPIYYVFSEEGICIVYLFSFREVIFWKDVIEVTRQPKKRPLYFSDYHFRVRKEAQGKPHFLAQSAINATPKTRELLRTYYQPSFEMKDK